MQKGRHVGHDIEEKRRLIGRCSAMELVMIVHGLMPLMKKSTKEALCLSFSWLIDFSGSHISFSLLSS